MAFILFVDSSNSVSLDPEWDFKDSEVKIDDRHRTRQGAGYQYRWGSYARKVFSVMYVNSSTKAIVNSWWNSNTALLFMEEGSSVVMSCYIMNDTSPIDGVVEPYQDKFSGTIKLETY